MSASQTLSSRVKCFLIALVVLLITGLVFAHSLSDDFVAWDDDIHVYHDRHLVPSVDVAFFWLHPYQNLYIPLSYTCFAGLTVLSRMHFPNPAVTKVGGLINPHVFHWASLIIHLTNTLLVFFLTRQILRKFHGDSEESGGIDLASGFGAMIYGVHPMQVESVAWISELRGLPAATCSLAAILLSMKRGWSSYIALVFLGAIALLFKPSAVTLVLLIAVVDVLISERSIRETALRALPLLVLSLPILWITRQVQPVPYWLKTPLWQRPFVAGDSLFFYVCKLVWPHPLTIVYGRSPFSLLLHPWAYWTWALPALIAVCIGKSGNRVIKTAGLVSVIALLPVLGFVPFVFQTYSTVADRYVYLALSGVSIAGAEAFLWILARSHGSKPKTVAAYLAGSGLICALAVTSVVACRSWENSLTLFRHAVEVDPASPTMHHNYGDALSWYGRDDEAIAQYREALRLKPIFASVNNNLGLLLLGEGRLPEAQEQFERVIQLDWRNPVGHVNLGKVLLAEGHPDLAIAEDLRAEQIAPGYRTAYGDLAGLYRTQGKTALALAQYQAALTANPHIDDLRTTYADYLMQLGEYSQAVPQYEFLEEDAPYSAPIRYSLANALAAGGQPNDAISQYQQAIALEPDNPQAYTALGLVYANLNRMGDAATAFRNALACDPTYAPAQADLKQAQALLGTTQ